MANRFLVYTHVPHGFSTSSLSGVYFCYNDNTNSSVHQRAHASESFDLRDNSLFTLSWLTLNLPYHPENARLGVSCNRPLHINGIFEPVNLSPMHGKFCSNSQIISALRIHSNKKEQVYTPPTWWDMFVYLQTVLVTHQSPSWTSTPKPERYERGSEAVVATGHQDSRVFC